jgi:hypothetical protein
MSTDTGLDRAVSYVQKLEMFRMELETVDVGCKLNGDKIHVETGRKYDRVYVQTFHNGTPNQKIARYFVDRHTWVIYACKSYTQINPRRVFGTLDTISEWEWSAYHGIPKSGTASEQRHLAREAEILKTQKPRGRPRKHAVA